MNLLHASHALALLLALMVRQRHERNRDTSDTVQKVAEAIIYMSEHLDQPMRVSALAALANLSATHFSVLFKVCSLKSTEKCVAEILASAASALTRIG